MASDIKLTNKSSILGSLLGILEISNELIVRFNPSHLFSPSSAFVALQDRLALLQSHVKKKRP